MSIITYTPIVSGPANFITPLVLYGVCSHCGFICWGCCGMACSWLVLMPGDNIVTSNLWNTWLAANPSHPHLLSGEITVTAP
jgi:hypothetical protein